MAEPTGYSGGFVRRWGAEIAVLLAVVLGACIYEEDYRFDRNFVVEHDGSTCARSIHWREGTPSCGYAQDVDLYIERHDDDVVEIRVAGESMAISSSGPGVDTFRSCPEESRLRPGDTYRYRVVRREVVRSRNGYNFGHEQFRRYCLSGDRFR